MRPTVLFPAAMNPIRTILPTRTPCTLPLDPCDVALEVAPHLAERIAAELLDHRVGEDDGDHRLADDGGSGHGDDVAPFPDRVGRLVGPQVHAPERPHQPRYPLHRASR